MKRFISLSLLALTMWSTAVACGYWGRPDYYVFSLFDREQMNGIDLKPMYQFWYDYVGINESTPEWLVDSSLRTLSDVDFDNLGETTNAVVIAAIKKNDKEMLDYLQLLGKHLGACSALEKNQWSYPTKEQIAQAKTNLQYINSRAKTYSGTRLRQQYRLLVMRTFMMLENYNAIIKYWKEGYKDSPQTIYKDMMLGIYAHALLQTGKRNEACDIYAQLGDMQSLKWTVREKRDFNGIKEMYAENPNSPTLVYLIQDYINNAHDTHDSYLTDYDFSWSENPAKEIAQRENDKVKFKNELTEFIAFAEKVLSQKKTKSPAMWQSAMGMAQHFLGQHSAAVKSLDKAMDMKGTNRMRDNARVCRFYVETARDDAKRGENFDNNTLKELQWLMQWDGNDFKQEDPHYAEALSRIVYSNLIPKYKDWGGYNVSTALAGMMETFTSYDGTPEGFYGDYYVAVDSLTAQEMKDYAAFVNSRHSNKFEQWLTTMVYKNEDDLNDRIGTKHMREGDFEEAIPYLEKVSLDFIKEQAIGRYAAQRDYNVERWFTRQVVDHYDYMLDVEAKPNKNFKLQFCRDLLKTEAQYDKASGELRNKLAYKLANYYYQASLKGDCWYMTRYGLSYYDQMGYKDECDLVGVAINLLNEAKNTEDFNLREKCLYALAFIPYGEEMIYYTYDANYNSIAHVNRDTHQYRALKELDTFFQNNRKKVSKRVSNCETLSRFHKEFL